MFNRIVFRSILIGAALAVTQLVHAGPKIQHWTSDEGVKVYYVEAPGLPLVDIQVIFDAGSARDGNAHGLASLTSMLLDTGAGNWDADDIAKRLDSAGTQLSSGVSRDSAWLSLRSLTDVPKLESALETLGTILASPKFDNKDFTREKQRVLLALRQREESPGDLAQLAFYSALYAEHPYAHPESGFLETVEPLNRDDLANFYESYYVANNAVMVVVGDVSRNRVEEIVAQLFADVAEGEAAADLPVVPELKKAAVSRTRFPSTQTHIFSGAPVLSRKDPDYVSLYVGNHILGGSGLVSKISEEVREKRGLSYSSYSHFSPMRDKGPFTMGLQTRNDQADDALDVLNQTLYDFIKTGPTAKELEAAKKNITGGFVLRYDSNQKLAQYIAMIGLYGLPLDYLDTFPKRVEVVTREQIRDAFKRRVKPDTFRTVLVGGAKATGAKSK